MRDLNNPNSDVLIRQVANLECAILAVLEASKYESDVQVIKHLLNSASLAKIYTSKSFDP